MKCMTCGTPYVNDFRARIGACGSMTSYTAYYNQSMLGERLNAHNNDGAIDKALEMGNRHNDTLRRVDSVYLGHQIYEERVIA